LGAYALLGEANKEKMGIEKIESVGVDYIPRVPKSKAYPGITTTLFEPGPAKMEAYNTIRRIIQDTKAFIKSNDAGVIPANPSSILCSPKFCPAHGTDFCEITKKANQKPNRKE